VLASEGRTAEAIAELKEAHRLAPENQAIDADLKSAMARKESGGK